MYVECQIPADCNAFIKTVLHEADKDNSCNVDFDEAVHFLKNHEKSENLPWAVNDLPAEEKFPESLSYKKICALVSNSKTAVTAP